MATAVAKTRDEPDLAPFRPARISVEQYQRMIASGAFREDDRVELLEGVVAETMPKNPPHEIATRSGDQLLSAVCPKGWHVRNQASLTLADSQPEPDLAVARGSMWDYPDHHPGPADTALVVEVADSSLADDRRKARIYARARIPVYWIVNLSQRCVEVYTSLRGAGQRAQYAKQTIYNKGDDVPVQIAGRRVSSIPVSDLLP